MNITLAQRIAQLNRRYYKAAVLVQVKRYAVVIGGLLGFGLAVGAVNHIL